MARIGYHASHEQYAPGELLRLVRRRGELLNEGITGQRWPPEPSATPACAKPSTSSAASGWRRRGDGFEEIDLHCVHRDQPERFIDVFGERVLPRLADTLT